MFEGKTKTELEKELSEAEERVRLLRKELGIEHVLDHCDCIWPRDGIPKVDCPDCNGMGVYLHVVRTK